jgi:putative lipoic acid-binding regulatory protein
VSESPPPRIAATDDPAALGDAFDRLEKLLDFPTDFPLKVMGRRVDGFAQSISALVRRHVPDFDPSTIELRGSSKGAYLSITIVARVVSRAQLEALYRDLIAHPMVKIVL